MIRYHAHRRSLVRDAARVLGEGAVFLFCVAVFVTLAWLIS